MNASAYIVFDKWSPTAFSPARKQSESQSLALLFILKSQCEIHTYFA